MEKFSTLSARDVQSRAMGSQGTDVVLSEAAFKCIPACIEAKNQEINKSLINMWTQTAENTDREGFPLLVVSANNSPVLAVLELDTLLHWIKLANEK